MPGKSKTKGKSALEAIKRRGNPETAGPFPPEVAAIVPPKQKPEVFVRALLPLIELEREAEMVASQDLVSRISLESAQRRGQTILQLKCTEQASGLLGRTLLTLMSNKPGPLPAHKFGPHDVVALRPSKAEPGASASTPPLCSGLVYRVKEDQLIVAVDDAPDEGMDQPLRLEKLANEVTYKRYREALERVAASIDGMGSSGGVGGATASLASASISTPTTTTPLALFASTAAFYPGTALVQVLFAQRPARFQAYGSLQQQPPDTNATANTPPPPPLPPTGLDQPPTSLDGSRLTWTPFNASLDPSQRAAISFALAAKDVSLIHGPPGTGKTTAVIELILQEVSRGARVLACAASNIAVDNLVERLARAAPRLRVVRMGHPARLLPQVLEHSLEAHIEQSESAALAADITKELKQLDQRLNKLGRKDYAERKQIRAEVRKLNIERRKREERAVDEVLKHVHVVCATLTGVASHHLRPLTFDVVVLDEAAQAMEPASWIALLKGRKAVLAGDHLQLPPTIISDDAARKGLAITMFERLQLAFGGDRGGKASKGDGKEDKEGIGRMLTVQYRMHERIMKWSSDELYHGRLSAHESVASHTLVDLIRKEEEEGEAVAKAVSPDDSAAAAAEASLPVLLMIDTTGCSMPEQTEQDGDSTWNEGEAKVAMQHVQRLIEKGIRAEDIGIITPYNAQVTALRELRTDKLSAVEISTVDGFQGREKEAIVISMVRSNEKREVGFLADKRRMNVAVTRARRHCCIICNAESVSSDAFLQRLVKYFEEHAEYASASEYV